MSILIKGLDMPKDDSELLCIEIWPNGRVSIDLDLCCEPVATAVEVPTPHGRLIDADALLEHLGDTEYKGAVKRVLMQAPTIIEAEVEK